MYVWLCMYGYICMVMYVCQSLLLYDFTCCYTLLNSNHVLTTSQSRKLAVLHEWAMSILGMTSKECSVMSAERLNLR